MRVQSYSTTPNSMRSSYIICDMVGRVVISPCNTCGMTLAAGQDGRALALLEGQLTWLVHIVGAIIKGRLSSSSAESQARRHDPACDQMTVLPVPCTYQ